MHLELFSPCSVEHGDAKVRGQMIVCGKCGGSARVPLTAKVGGGNDDRQIELIAMRKFSKMGWVIGKSVSRHRCPTCQNAVKPFAALGNLTTTNLASAVKKAKEEFMPATKSPTMGPSFAVIHNAATGARGMSRDDRRVIFAKLNDVYLTERTGYGGGWTDKKVAADLGIPVEWVVEVRNDHFGPDTNIAAQEQITASSELIIRVNELLGAVARLSEEVVPLKAAMEKAEADVISLKQQLGE